MSTDDQTDRIAALVDALRASTEYCRFDRYLANDPDDAEHDPEDEVRDVIAIKGEIDVPKLYDRLADHFAREQPGNGFEMLFEQQEKIGELEAEHQEWQDRWAAHDEVLDRKIKSLQAELENAKSHIGFIVEGSMHQVSKLEAEIKHLREEELWSARVNADESSQLWAECRELNASLEAELAAAKAPATVEPTLARLRENAMSGKGFDLSNLTDEQTLARLRSHYRDAQPDDRRDDGGAA